jgi:hypothetical protein
VTARIESTERRRRAVRLRTVVVTALLAAVAAVLVPSPAVGASGGSSISGTAWFATDGSPVGGVDVSLYEYQTFEVFGSKVRATVPIADTTTAADGSYLLSGLKPSPKGGYFVCFTVPTGHITSVGVCWADQFWLDGPSNSFGAVQLSPSASAIKLRAGQRLTGVNADLVDPDTINSGTAGSVSGTVTHARGRRPLAGAVVTAFGAHGKVFGQAVTGADGTYKIDNLLGVQSPYQICFDGDMSRAGFPPHRFGQQCWNGIGWTTAGPPMDAAPVTVTAGDTTGSIDANLRA